MKKPVILNLLLLSSVDALALDAISETLQCAATTSSNLSGLFLFIFLAFVAQFFSS